MTIVEVLELNSIERVFFKRPKHIDWLWCDSLKLFVCQGDDYESYSLYIEDILAKDWEIKKERPKVAQYMYESYNNRCFITTEFFENDEQFKNMLCSLDQDIKFKRLTEIDPL